MVIVVILPLTQLLVKQVDIVADAVLVEQLVELLVVDAMGAFHLPVETRGPRPDVHVPDVSRLEVLVELRLELGAVVGLHHVDAKRQTSKNFVDEQDRRALIARIVDLQHTNPSAIVDGRELKEPASRAGNSFQELHIQLQSMAGLRLFVALPALAVRLVLLIRRQPRHAVPRQDAMHRRDRDGDLVEPMQVGRDAASPEVIVRAQVEDTDHLPRGDSRRPLRRSRPIAEAGVTVVGVATLLFVERLPGNAEPAADPGDVSLVGRLP
jgi:hypothetical protein